MLSELPRSLLASLLSDLLAPEDRRTLRAVCKATRAATNLCVETVLLHADLVAATRDLRILSRFPGVRNLVFRDGLSSFSTCKVGSVLEGLGQYRTQVVSVDVKCCQHMAPSTLRYLAEGCPALRQLALSRWMGQALLPPLAILPALRCLDLGDADLAVMLITNDSLLSVAALTQLEQLNLQHCACISDQGLAHLSTLQGLRKLDISYTHITGHSVSALPRSLQVLRMEGCSRVGDEGLAALVSLQGLTQLELAGTAVSNQGLQLLVELPLLASLDLGSRFTLTDSGLSVLSACPSLSRLRFGNTAIMSAPPAALPHLQSLEFGGVYSNRGVERLFPLAKLTSLSIRGYDSVTDEVLAVVCKAQPLLCVLSLSGGHQLTSAGIATLAHLPRLSDLRLSCCPHIGPEFLAVLLAAAPPALRRLNVGQCPRLSSKVAQLGNEARLVCRVDQ